MSKFDAILEKPTISGEPLSPERFAAWTQELQVVSREVWQQESQPGLLQCLKDIWIEHFGAEKFAVFSLADSERLRLIPLRRKLRQAVGFKADERQALKAELSTLNLSAILQASIPLSKLDLAKLDLAKVDLNADTKAAESKAGPQSLDSGIASEWSDEILTIQAAGLEIECARLALSAGKALLICWSSRPLIAAEAATLGGAQPDTLPDLLRTRGMMRFVLAQAAQQMAWFAKQDQAKSLLYIDDLTGLFNHRYLDVALDNELRRAQRFEHPFAVIFIDLDNFKEVNDRHGHMAGSAVLQQLGKLLKETLREIDSVIRYGGDEYVVILLEADHHMAGRAAERIREKVSGFRFDVGDQSEATVTCSLGIACFPEDGATKEALLKVADSNMYYSKRSGKNRVSAKIKRKSDKEPGDGKSRMEP